MYTAFPDRKIPQYLSSGAFRIFLGAPTPKVGLFCKLLSKTA